MLLSNIKEEQDCYLTNIIALLLLLVRKNEQQRPE